MKFFFFPFYADQVFREDLKFFIWTPHFGNFEQNPQKFTQDDLLQAIVAWNLK